MNNQYEEEYEINLIALMWELLFRWKPVLLTAILTAALLGGYKYYKDSKASAAVVSTIKQESVTTREDYANMEAELSAGMSKADSDTVYEMVERAVRLSGQEKYLQNSAFMKIDPFNERTLTLIYKIESDDYPEWITSAYVFHIYSDEFEDVLEKAFNLPESSSAYELIVSASSMNKTLGIYQTADNNNNGIDGLQVVLRIPSECIIKDVAETVTDDILSYKREGSTSDHKISYEGYYVSTSKYDQDLNTAQTTYASAFKTGRDAFMKEAEALTGDKLNLLTYALRARRVAEIVGLEEKASDQTVSPVVTAPAPVSVDIKYIAIGFVLGIILYAGLVFVKYIFFPKVSYVMGLGALENLPSFGILEADSKKNTFIYSPFIKKIRDRKRPGKDAQVKNTVSAMDYYRDKDKNESLSFLYLGEESDIVKAQYDKIKASSGNGNCSLISLPTDPSSENTLFETLEKIGGSVVILTEYDKTPLRKISLLLKLLADRKIKVLGSIGIEG